MSPSFKKLDKYYIYQILIRKIKNGYEDEEVSILDRRKKILMIEAIVEWLKHPGLVGFKNEGEASHQTVKNGDSFTAIYEGKKREMLVRPREFLEIIRKVLVCSQTKKAIYEEPGLWRGNWRAVFLLKRHQKSEILFIVVRQEGINGIIERAEILSDWWKKNLTGLDGYTAVTNLSLKYLQG